MQPARIPPLVYGFLLTVALLSVASAVYFAQPLPAVMGWVIFLGGLAGWRRVVWGPGPDVDAVRMPAWLLLVRLVVLTAAWVCVLWGLAGLGFVVFGDAAPGWLAVGAWFVVLGLLLVRIPHRIGRVFVEVAEPVGD